MSRVVPSGSEAVTSGTGSVALGGAHGRGYSVTTAVPEQLTMSMLPLAPTCRLS